MTGVGYKDETRSCPGGAYGKRRHVKMMFDYDNDNSTTTTTLYSLYYVPGAAHSVREPIINPFNPYNSPTR